MRRRSFDRDGLPDRDVLPRFLKHSYIVHRRGWDVLRRKLGRERRAVHSWLHVPVRRRGGPRAVRRGVPLRRRRRGVDCLHLGRRNVLPRVRGLRWGAVPCRIYLRRLRRAARALRRWQLRCCGFWHRCRVLRGAGVAVRRGFHHRRRHSVSRRIRMCGRGRTGDSLHVCAGLLVCCRQQLNSGELMRSRFLLPRRHRCRGRLRCGHVLCSEGRLCGSVHCGGWVLLRRWRDVRVGRGAVSRGPGVRRGR